MIDLSLFFTPTLQGAKPQSVLTAPVAQRGLGLGEVGAGNFMDMFLAGLTVDGEKKSDIAPTVFLTKKTPEQVSDKTAVDVQSLLDSLTQEQIDQHGDPLFSLPPEILALLKDDGVVEDTGDVKTGLLDLLHQIAAQGTLREKVVVTDQNSDAPDNTGKDGIKSLPVVAMQSQTPVEKFLAALSLTVANSQPEIVTPEQKLVQKIMPSNEQGIQKKPDLSWIGLISSAQQNTLETPQQVPFESLPVETQKMIITKLNDLFKSLLVGTSETETKSVDSTTLINAVSDRFASDVGRLPPPNLPPHGGGRIKEGGILLPNHFIISLPKEMVSDQSPTLIATNLTPQKLTEAIDALVKKFTDSKKTEQSDPNAEQANPLLALLVQILPPPEKGVTLTSTMDTTLSAKLPQLQQNETPDIGNVSPPETMDEMAARLNDLVVGSNKETETAEISPALEEKDSPLRGFAKVLEMLERSNGRADTPPQGLEKASDHIKTHIVDPSNMLKQSNAGQNILSALVLPQASLTNDPNAATLPQQISFTTVPLTGAAPAANLMLQAPQAGQAHPATQMVAATIAKNAKDGESKAMTLHLDPPELGRLQVKMEFGRDKTVKAHLVIEKPETYMMLQRDAQMLERTLQQSGFDVDNGGVSFELSQGGGNLFDHNDRNQGNGNTYGGADAAFDDDGMEIIETTVNWQVDSATGQTHYDLWA